MTTKSETRERLQKVKLLLSERRRTLNQLADELDLNLDSVRSLVRKAMASGEYGKLQSAGSAVYYGRTEVGVDLKQRILDAVESRPVPCIKLCSRLGIDTRSLRSHVDVINESLGEDLLVFTRVQVGKYARVYLSHLSQQPSPEEDLRTSATKVKSEDGDTSIDYTPADIQFINGKQTVRQWTRKLPTANPFSEMVSHLSSLS